MAELAIHEWHLIMNSMNGFVLSDTLYAASELDLFTHIETQRSPTLESLAQAMELSHHSARVLLLACCATGLIERDPTTFEYKNSTAASKALLSTSSHNLRPFIRFNHLVQQRCGARLLDSLRENRNVGLDEIHGQGETLYERLSDENGLLEIFQRGMAAYSLFGPKIVRFEELRHVRHLLDVGGGKGAVAQYLTAEGGPKVTVLDRPEVCHNGRQQTKSPSIRFQDCDIFKDKWPQDADGILFSHLLEIFSLKKVEALYTKAFHTLPVNGRVFIWTLTSEPNELGGLQAAKSSTYFMSVASGEGMAYPAEQHLQLLQKVGFEIERIYDRQEFDHHGLVAIKK